MPQGVLVQVQSRAPIFYNIITILSNIVLCAAGMLIYPHLEHSSVLDQLVIIGHQLPILAIVMLMVLASILVASIYLVVVTVTTLSPSAA